MAGTASLILSRALIHHHGEDSPLAEAMGKNASGEIKGLVSLAAYVLALPLTFLHPGIGRGPSIAVALLGVVLDRRIEARLR